ncbi:L-lactate dehydrogenase B-A chain [Drosophila bipectinata]|uniref:L-lactate dehydrogenase B-A chain n=1 Tax=Drosophila bipectinata TaxID=42026 RepID=UPI001C899EC4|nr:L-lactate dehydrogenase B chain [Drosophila bipectinata]
MRKIIRPEGFSNYLNLYRSFASKCGGKSDEKEAKKSAFSSLVKPMKDSKRKPGFKITVVGAGKVGLACCSYLLDRRLAKELVIMDIQYERAQAEALDFNHGSVFLGEPKVVACGDGAHTKDSDLIVFTAGVRPGKKSRLEVMHDTVKILKAVVPKLVELSPKAIYLVIANPADVMTYAFQKIGKLPKHRCFTSGCHLDTARFRYYVAQHLKVPASAVQGFVIGEHGDSAVPVWSSVQVAGSCLRDVAKNPGCGDDPEKWAEIERKVICGGASVSRVKGYTDWAVALSAIDIVEAISGPYGKIMSVGTDMKGIQGIEDNVVLSMPCMVTSAGISYIYEMALTNGEYEKLHKSADILLKAQCKLKL